MIFQSKKRGVRASQKNKLAFSRTDLLVITLVVLLLVGWFGMAHLGERGRIAKCSANLAFLGKAMHSYANDNDGALPAAGSYMDKTPVSWDVKVVPYLKLNRAKLKGEGLFTEAPKILFCPSDPAPHNGLPRSYAMGAHDMSPQNWPPGPNSKTGVGLWWDSYTTPLVLGQDAVQKHDPLPSVKLSSLPAPADTILLTEFIDSQNILGTLSQTSVRSVIQQRAFFKDNSADFHFGKFNYLMADGHVELLSSLQTGAFDGTAGIWSIKKGD